jgi:glutathione peroxidase-family protein
MTILENEVYGSHDEINKVLELKAPEFTLPVSIYDIELPSADGTNKNLLSNQKGKVTLLFNVAAGCGNIPQHGNLEKLNQMYKDEPNFSIIAVVVDDFMCHGYPEFQDGIEEYIKRKNMDTTPGQVAKKYAEEHFGTTYEFTELTNGRHDKHTYDSDFAPGSQKLQDQHALWSYLTGAFEADLQDNGVPFHNEEVPWSNAKPPKSDGKKTFFPLTGNFTKFLIDKTGTKVRRYANGFLLGERNIFGETFPWFPEKYTPEGKRDHNPITEKNDILPGDGPYPTKIQQFGIEVSLMAIKKDIDDYLNQ